MVRTGSREYSLTIPLVGDFQLENASAAVAALEVLTQSGARITQKAISDGFRQVQWPGRFHILKRDPLVIVDGAHNAYSVRRLIETIQKYVKYKKCHSIFGTSCDKDIPGIVRELIPLSPRVIVARASHPRSAPPSAVAAEFIKAGVKPEVADTVPEGLARALSLASEHDLICATGSLFLVAEALDYFSED